ncbi:hypothetical protein [Polyangium jinanense]|uniref:Lipoprotein n=1 Tax=Polyangium jinanense TaxID=2829994 RepID=A0A9X3XDK5_9BACT|nr:hypothetical protein [Polyangium jinanense]MDC3958866.1 hypothetical protein [Polyangium jinanense]MDC3985981.1 hypothetical protein [Polyangium jinanense]
MKPYLFLSLSFALAAGCGGTTPDAASDTPEDVITVGNTTLTPRSTIWARKESMTTPWISPMVHIMNFDDACGVFPDGCTGTNEPNVNVMLSFSLHAQNPGPGTYDVGTFDEATTPASAKVAWGVFRHYEEKKATFTSEIVGGNVVVDQFDDTTLRGDYTFTFDTGETRQGTFEATYCEGLDKALTCM